MPGHLHILAPGAQQILSQRLQTELLHIGCQQVQITACGRNHGGGLAAGCGAGIEHALAGLRCKQLHAIAGGRVCHIQLPCPQRLQRQRAMQLIPERQLLQRLPGIRDFRRRIHRVQAGIYRGRKRVPLQHGTGIGLAEFLLPALHQPGGGGILHRQRQSAASRLKFSTAARRIAQHAIHHAAHTLRSQAHGLRNSSVLRLAENEQLAKTEQHQPAHFFLQLTGAKLLADVVQPAHIAQRIIHNSLQQSAVGRSQLVLRCRTGHESLSKNTTLSPTQKGFPGKISNGRGIIHTINPL